MKKQISVGVVDSICMLTKSIVMVDGWCAGGDPSRISIEALSGSKSPYPATNTCQFSRSDLPEGSHAFCAVFPLDEIGDGLSFSVSPASGSGGTLRMDPAIEVAKNAVSRLLQLKNMYGEAQAATLGKFVLQAAAGKDTGTDEVFAVNRLAVLSDAKLEDVRDRYFPGNVATIDLCIQLDADHIAIVGWGRNLDEDIAGIELELIEGTRVPILETAVRYDRPDVSQLLGPNAGSRAGFAVCLKAPHPIDQPQVDILFQGQNGFERVSRHELSSHDALAGRRQLLSSFGPSSQIEDIFRDYLSPALTALESKIEECKDIAQTFNIGGQPKNPLVSIIVPAYHGLEFITQQIVQFSKDPDIAQNELIYVLDSPAEASNFVRSLQGLYELYGVSCKVFVLTNNVGFSAANNLGVSRSNGQYLLLLNQDVIPDQPGWLGKMVSFYQDHADAGAVGPKLLYEDDAIQHAGMYFQKISPGGKTWHNFHYFKGLHRSFDNASVSRPVPAVTAACLLVERTLYDEVGGLDEGYVMGDFEDSDFCLKCRKAGRQNYYQGDVELYHLERQSFGSIDHERWRSLALSYNGWRQTRQWGAMLSELEQQPAED